MKQKNNQVKAKSNLNGVQKDQGIKKQNKPEPVEQVVTKKGKNQKPVQAVPPKKVEEVKEEVEDLENEEDDSGADVAAEDQASGGEEEAEEHASGDEESDDDAPAEEPIGKKGQGENSVGIAKIKHSAIPKDYPKDQIIAVKNMPKKGGFKQVDVVEVFAKYGTLDYIYPLYKKDFPTTVLIAYSTAEAAQAALAADKSTIKGVEINVCIKKLTKREQILEEKKKAYEEKRKHVAVAKDRIVYVKNLKLSTNEEQLRELFAECGGIESISLVAREGFTYGFVTFAAVESVEKALKLHNSDLNGATIGVYLHGDSASKAGAKDPKRTVILKNVQQFESFPGATIKKIFVKFGEIEDIDIICKKNVLAFITFKDESSVKQALELNDTTEEELQINIMRYQLPETNTSVFILNVKTGTTEEEIREFFKDTGAISTVFLKHNFSIVKFADTDGFCKSFLLNERFLAGQPVFLEPYSEKKKHVMKRQKRKHPFNNSFGGGFKRRRQNTE